MCDPGPYPEPGFQATATVTQGWGRKTPPSNGPPPVKALASRGHTANRRERQWEAHPTCPQCCPGCRWSGSSWLLEPLLSPHVQGEAGRGLLKPHCTGELVMHRTNSNNQTSHHVLGTRTCDYSCLMRKQPEAQREREFPQDPSGQTDSLTCALNGYAPIRANL